MFGLAGVVLAGLGALLWPDEPPRPKATTASRDTPRRRPSPARLAPRARPVVAEAGGLPPGDPYADVHVGGVVFDAETKLGIEGAFVTIGPKGPGPRLGAPEGDGRIGARTGPDGTYALRGVPPGIFELTARAPGYVTASSTLEKWSTVEDDDGFDFGLLSARLVEGEVRTRTNEPVPGAEVFPVRADGSRGRSTQTDGSGHFLLDEVWTTETAVVATRAREGTAGVRLGPSDERGWVVIVLPDRRAKGVVRSAHGPIAGASVVVEMQKAGGLRIGRSTQGVTTGEEGRFEIGLSETGPAVLRAAAAGHVAQRVVIEEVGTEAVHPVELVLPPAIEFSGRVLDRGMEPVAHAEVRAAAGSASAAGRTDRFGRFRLDGLPETGPYRIEVRHDGHPTYRAEEARLGVDHEIVLEASSLITGRVLDGSAGGPITAYAYTLLGPVERRRRCVSQSGAFEIGRLLPGRYTLAVEADGYLPKEVTGIDLPSPGAEVEVSIRLDPAGGLAGRVVGGSNVIVTAWRAGRPVASTETNDTGEFFVGELAPGLYRVVAESKRGQATLSDIAVEKGQTTSNLRIELERSRENSD